MMKQNISEAPYFNILKELELFEWNGLSVWNGTNNIYILSGGYIYLNTMIFILTFGWNYSWNPPESFKNVTGKGCMVWMDQRKTFNLIKIILKRNSMSLPLVTLYMKSFYYKTFALLLFRSSLISNHAPVQSQTDIHPMAQNDKTKESHNIKLYCFPYYNELSFFSATGYEYGSSIFRSL